MSNSNLISVDCQKVVQKNVEFLVGKLPASELVQLVSVTHRAIMSFDENGLPEYNKKIQRKPSPVRVASIRDYLINDKFATFPNNILISIPSILLAQEVIENSNSSTLVIDKSKISFDEQNPLYLQIFDGQHRFRGIQEAIKYLEMEDNDKEQLKQIKEFEFVISFFIDAEIDFQAMLFSVINRTPVKVSQDLVSDLFGLMDTDSPQKTALAIALKSNGQKYYEYEDTNNLLIQTDGPFYKRIKLLAKKVKDENSPISQGMFIKAIVLLISPDIKAAEKERNFSRKELNIGGNNRTIFRKFYSDNNDHLIYKVIMNYFVAVDETFKDINSNSYWNFDKSQDNALQRTIGFLALIEVLIKLFPIGWQDKNLSVNFFKQWLSKAKDIKFLNLDGSTRFPYTSLGKGQLERELLRLIFEKNTI